MTSQVFYRKWRPQALAEVARQEHVTHTLLNALSRVTRIPRLSLLRAPRHGEDLDRGASSPRRSTALTTARASRATSARCARRLPRGARSTLSRSMRPPTAASMMPANLREKVNYAPNQARFKVYIIDEVHMLTTEASNALLKTLEEPPQRVIFILATTEPHELLPTILSRCQRFDFHRISPQDIMAKLSEICGKEGIKIDSDGLRLVTRSANGGLRDAENILGAACDLLRQRDRQGPGAEDARQFPRTPAPANSSSRS